MLTQRLTVSVPKLIRRNFGIVAPALQKASDPIQQLFLDKLHEYTAKSAGGNLVDPTPDLEKERKAELEKLAKQYGGDGKTNMSEFPRFNFQDPPVDTTSVKK